MSKHFYIVAMADEGTDETEVAYASTPSNADKMIEKLSTTDGFDTYEYRSYKATLDYLEVNGEVLSFEEPVTDNSDLIVQFAILWGQEIGGALTSKERKIAAEMKQWTSDELARLFAAWADEYLKQDEIEDSCDFFQMKSTNLLHE